MKTILNIKIFMMLACDHRRFFLCKILDNIDLTANITT